MLFREVFILIVPTIKGPDTFRNNTARNYLATAVNNKKPAFDCCQTIFYSSGYLVGFLLSTQKKCRGTLGLVG